MKHFKENILFKKSKYRIIRYIKSRILVILFYVFRIIPIDNKKIVVDSYRGMGYYGNHKYITEALINKKVDCKIIWLSKSYKAITSEKIKVIPFHTIRSVFHLCTANIWVDNCRKDYWTRKRNKQFYIQTWHGGIGPKCVEKDAIGKVSNEYILGAINDSKMANLFISNSDFATDSFRKSFWYNGNILEKGLPRNDILINENKETSEKIRKELKIPNNTKIILYAPTFRKDFNVVHHQKNFSQLINFLESTTDAKWTILLHLHPNLWEKSNLLMYTNKFINANCFDIQELIIASDILITDYSSIMFDFALTDKPVFLYTFDLDAYKGDRNFCVDFNSLPFSHANTLENLIKEFKNFNYKKYVNKLRDVFNEFGIKETGKASDEIVKIIIDKISEEL